MKKDHILNKVRSEQHRDDAMPPPQGNTGDVAQPVPPRVVAMDPLLKASQQMVGVVPPVSQPSHVSSSSTQKPAKFTPHAAPTHAMYDPTAATTPSDDAPMQHQYGTHHFHQNTLGSPGTKRAFGSTPTGLNPKYPQQQFINTTRAQGNPLRSNGSAGTPTHTGHMSYAASTFGANVGRMTPSTPSTMRTPGTPSGHQYPTFGSPSSSHYQQQQQQYQYPPELISQSPISAHVQADIPEDNAGVTDVSRRTALSQPEKSIKETFFSEDGQKITVVSVKKRKNIIPPQPRTQLLAQQQQQKQQQGGRATKKRKLNNGTTKTTKKKTTTATKGKKKAATTAAAPAKTAVSQPSGVFGIPMQPLVPSAAITPPGTSTFTPPVGHIYQFPKNPQIQTPTQGVYNPHFQIHHAGIKPPQPRGITVAHTAAPQQGPDGSMPQQQPQQAAGGSASSLQSSVSPQFHPSQPQYNAASQPPPFMYATPGTPSGGSHEFPSISAQQAAMAGGSGGTPTPVVGGTPQQQSASPAGTTQQQQFYFPTTAPSTSSHQMPPPMGSVAHANPFANAPGMAPPATSTTARKRKAEIDESLHCEIRVSNLPDELCCNEAYLRQLFSECGDVYRLRVPTLALPFALNKPKYKGVAYVKYTTLVGADRAIRKFNDQTVSGKRLRVEIFQLPKVAPGAGDTGSGPSSSHAFESSELYVVNLPHAILNDESAVQNMWEQYGPVISCAVPKNAQGVPSGYIFVKYKNARDAKNALAMNNTFHHGRRIQVRFADKKHQNRNNFSGYTSWIFIGGLNPNTSTTEIRQTFSAFGQIEEIDDSQVESKAYAFLKYRSVESVREALRFKRDGVYVLERMNQADQEITVKQMVQRDEPIDDMDEDPDDPYLPDTLQKELYAWRGQYHYGAGAGVMMAQHYPGMHPAMHHGQVHHMHHQVPQQVQHHQSVGYPQQVQHPSGVQEEGSKPSTSWE